MSASVATLRAGRLPCRCAEPLRHAAKLIVLTGGPSAGKTAVLDLVEQSLCSHMAILPEAASIVFGGGFPRHDNDTARKAAQRAIYRVQREVEEVVRAEREVAIGLCDRATLDGLAYWPGSTEAFFSELSTTREAELGRYAAVIHLRTPAATDYDRTNPLRIESAREALEVDARIEAAWAGHPRRFFVESAADFFVKAARAVERVRAELPSCCRAHLGLEA